MTNTFSYKRYDSTHQKERNSAVWNMRVYEKKSFSEIGKAFNISSCRANEIFRKLEAKKNKLLQDALMGEKDD